MSARPVLDHIAVKLADWHRRPATLTDAPAFWLRLTDGRDTLHVIDTIEPRTGDNMLDVAYRPDGHVTADRDAPVYVAPEHAKTLALHILCGYCEGKGKHVSGDPDAMTLDCQVCDGTGQAQDERKLLALPVRNIMSDRALRNITRDLRATPDAAGCEACVTCGRPADERMAPLDLLNRLIDLGAQAAHANAQSNSDDGHKGTAAAGRFRNLRNDMARLIAEHVTADPVVPDDWRATVQEFCDRVNRGEVRSVTTYAKFQRLLAGLPPVASEVAA